MVAAECTFEINIRVPNGLDAPLIRAEIDKILLRYPEASYRQINYNPPSWCPPDSEMAQLVRANAQAVAGIDPVNARREDALGRKTLKQSGPERSKSASPLAEHPPTANHTLSGEQFHAPKRILPPALTRGMLPLRRSRAARVRRVGLPAAWPQLA